MTPFSIAFLFVFAVSLVSADDTSSAEQLHSDDGLSGNNTDASDGKVTIEEQYDEDNSTMTTRSNSSSVAPPSSSVSPGAQTTTPKSGGKPRAPSFAGWSFFIGIVVAFLIIGIAVFVVKFFCQRRHPGNNVPYTAYST